MYSQGLPRIGRDSNFVRLIFKSLNIFKDLSNDPGLSSEIKTEENLLLINERLGGSKPINKNLVKFSESLEIFFSKILNLSSLSKCSPAMAAVVLSFVLNTS